MCNFCGDPSGVVFDGDYVDSPDAGWLKKLLQHMIDNHPTVFGT